MRTAEADYGLTTQAMDPVFNPGQVDPDLRLRVSFGYFPEPDQEASAKEGRPIFKEKVYITIIIPGERDVTHRAAWQKDFDRFPRQYAAFLNKRDQEAASGTPLKLMPWLSLSQIKELEYFNCVTVEQLANMPDSTSQKFLQIQKLKQLAKDYLQAAKEAAPLTKMRAELDERDNRIAALESQLAKVMEKLEEQEE